jgi:hypothetical protein
MVCGISSLSSSLHGSRNFSALYLHRDWFFLVSLPVSKHGAPEE